jgi:prevent-host-death family protein
MGVHMTREIGVRALRQELSKILDQVSAGETIVVTRDGAPVARIAPIRPPIPPSLQNLIDAGRVTWAGKPFEMPEPVPLTGGGPTVADILLAQRGDALPG